MHRKALPGFFRAPDPSAASPDQIAEFAAGFDGYVGEIPRSAATIAQVLSSYGYDTGAFGKWHNTPITHVTPTSPFDLWPWSQPH